MGQVGLKKIGLMGWVRRKDCSPFFGYCKAMVLIELSLPTYRSAQVKSWV